MDDLISKKREHSKYKARMLLIHPDYYKELIGELDNKFTNLSANMMENSNIQLLDMTVKITTEVEKFEIVGSING